MKRILIALTSLSLIAGFAVATPARVNASLSASTYMGTIDLYVSQFGVADGVADGGTCSDPDFNTIQDAVDFAEWYWADATEIYICNGIYYEQIDSTIGLTLVGEHRLKTIIDGSQNGENRIITHDDEFDYDDIAIWDMTIRNGYNYDYAGSYRGGAVRTESNFYCFNSVFSNNYAEEHGGAVYAAGDAYVNNCLFDANEAGDDEDGEGGAIYTESSFGSERSTFTNNYADYGGGAVRADELDYSRFDIFTNNESEEDDGGAIYVDDGYGAEVLGSVFRQNIADEEGGAVAFSYEYELTITSSSFIGNEAGDNGGALYLNGDDSDDYLIVTGGVTTPTIFQGNSTRENGGAIFVEDEYGTNGMSVTNARFTDNIAAEAGGAISSANEINLTGTTFTGNRSLGEDGVGGGAVYGEESITVSRSTFTRNSAIDTDGGAIWSDDDLTVTSSTFTNNAADDGGAIKVFGNLTVEGSTFTGNQAQGDLNDGSDCDDDGPAFCAGEGGAIFTSAEETLITRSTFKNNSATDEGGAIMGEDDGGTPELRIQNSTFIGNQAEEAGALSSRTLDFLELRGNLFQANRAYGVDFTPNFSWAVGAVMVETNGDPYVIAGNRFISNVGWGVGALYIVDDGCADSGDLFSAASVRANTWRSNRVTGGQPQSYRDVRHEGSFNDGCYTITYDVNDGVLAGDEDTFYDDGDSAITEPSAPTRAGYIFGGWYRDDSTFLLPAFPLTPTADTTVYAKWIAD